MQRLKLDSPADDLAFSTGKEVCKCLVVSPPQPLGNDMLRHVFTKDFGAGKAEQLLSCRVVVHHSALVVNDDFGAQAAFHEQTVKFQRCGLSTLIRAQSDRL